MKRNKVTYTSGDRTLVIDGTWLELRDNNSNRLNVILMDYFYGHNSSMSVRRIEKIGKLLFLLLDIENSKHKSFTELMIFNERGEVITPFQTRPKGELVKRPCGRKNEYSIPVTYEGSIIFKRGDSAIDFHELTKNRVLLLKFNEEGVIEYGRIKLNKFNDTYLVLKRMRSSWKFTKEEGKIFASIEIGGKEFKVDAVRIYENDKLLGGCFEVCRETETDRVFCKSVLSYDGKAYIKIPNECCVDPLGVNLAKVQNLPNWREQYYVISRSGKVVIPNIVAKAFYKIDSEVACQFNSVNDIETGNEKLLFILINNKPVGCAIRNDIKVDSHYTADSEILFTDEYIKLYMKQENPFKDGTKEALAFDIMKYEVRKNYLLSF